MEQGVDIVTNDQSPAGKQKQHSINTSHHLGPLAHAEDRLAYLMRGLKEGMTHAVFRKPGTERSVLFPTWVELNVRLLSN